MTWSAGSWHGTSSRMIRSNRMMSSSHFSSVFYLKLLSTQRVVVVDQLERARGAAQYNCFLCNLWPNVPVLFNLPQFMLRFTAKIWLHLNIGKLHIHKALWNIPLLMVNVFTLHSDDLSLNHAAVFNFYCLLKIA